jgi:hypothetical protein
MIKMKCMRIMIIAAIFISLANCVKKQSVDSRELFTVAKIDSSGNFYLVYAVRNDSTFKIVSKKNIYKECDGIAINKSYPFKLRSSIFTGKVANGQITAMTNDLVECVGYDSVTTICFEDNCVRDLFSSDNLKGLCFSGD